MMNKDETLLPIHEFTWPHLQTCSSQVSCLVCAGSWPPHVVSLQVVQSARALQWIIDTLKSQDFAAKDAPTLSTWILSFYFHIYTMTVSHKHTVSCRFHNRWGLWPNHQHYKERGPAPCERPTVSLPRRQSQTFPRSRGESPVGGISQHHWWRNVVRKISLSSGISSHKLFPLSDRVWHLPAQIPVEQWWLGPRGRVCHSEHIYFHLCCL